MAERVRISGGAIGQESNEGKDAQVNSEGSLHIIPGIGGAGGTYPGYNVAYEDTTFLTGDSPATHDFNADAGRNAVGGWIICDGAGNIQVDFSRDGVNYSGSKWTMKKGERVNLENLDIDKIRVTWVSNSAYRINLI